MTSLLRRRPYGRANSPGRRRIELSGARHTAAEREDAHPRRETRLNARDAVFDHGTVIGRYPHRVGGQQEDGGIGFAVRHVIGAEDAARESLGQPSKSELEVQHRVTAARGDTGGHRDQFECLDDALDRDQFALAHLANARFEFDVPIDATSDLLLDH